MPTPVEEQIEQARSEFNARLDEIRAAAQGQSSQAEQNPAVVQAATELARQVARSKGIDMPLQAAPGASLPVVELPPEFLQAGGVGVAVVVAAPPGSQEEAAEQY